MEKNSNVSRVTVETEVSDLVADRSCIALTESHRAIDNCVSIASLNCKNIKANFEYVKLLQASHNIIFLQETIDNLIYENFFIYSKSSMKDDSRRGRPYGGVMWLCKKTKKNPIVTFETERISTFELDDIFLIGVYLRFNDNNYQTLIEHESDIAQILDLVDKANQLNKKVAIIGDFNSDLSRNSQFDNVLKNIINNEDLICVDHWFTQQVDYTYFSGNNRSRIDHVLVNIKMAECIDQVNIMQDSINTSDHLALSLNLHLSNLNNFKTAKKNKKLRTDWTNLENRKIYENKLSELLVKLDLEKIMNADENEIVESMDILINNVNSCMRVAEKSIVQISKPKKHIKKKSWWDEEMQYIKEQINLAYLNYKNSYFKSNELKLVLQTLKKHFRFKQREKVKFGQKSFHRKI